MSLMLLLLKYIGAKRGDIFWSSESTKKWAALPFKPRYISDPTAIYVPLACKRQLHKLDWTGSRYFLLKASNCLFAVATNYKKVNIITKTAEKNIQEWRDLTNKSGPIICFCFCQANTDAKPSIYGMYHTTCYWITGMRRAVKLQNDYFFWC